MKKSLRLFIATLVMAAAVAAAGVSHKQVFADGTDPCPMCPPGGCVLTN